MRHQAHRAPVLPASGLWVSPQGRVEQGWPARRCSSEPEVICIDRMVEAYDEEDDQSESADGWLWFFVAILLAMFCAWCVANYLRAPT